MHNFKWVKLTYNWTVCIKIHSNLANLMFISHIHFLFSRTNGNPKATAPPNAARCCVALQNSANVAPLRAARRVKILFFGILILHGRGVFTTRDSTGYYDWPQSNAEKMRRRERNFSQLSFRGAACSPCNDKHYGLSFYKARRSVWLVGL